MNTTNAAAEKKEAKITDNEGNIDFSQINFF